MKLSIALCTHNGEKYLATQLVSYLTQKRLPDELVVCDDQSTDRTIEILERFADQSPFPVRLHVNDRNLDSTKNFEKAFQLCEGEIIVPSDQDDVWHESKLNRLEAAFNENSGIGLVLTDANVVDANLKPLDYTLWQSINFTKNEQKKVCAGDVIPVLLKHNIVTGATMAFRANLRDIFMPISALWVHDAWIAFMIALVADILLLSEPLIHYRQHGQNQVGTPGTKIFAQVDHALNQRRDLQRQIHDRYCVLRDYIVSKFSDKEVVIRHINAQIQHRKTRSTLPDNRLQRIPVILGQLFAQHYQRYSSGYYSALKDLLF